MLTPRSLVIIAGIVGFLYFVYSRLSISFYRVLPMKSTLVGLFSGNNSYSYPATLPLVSMYPADVGLYIIKVEFPLHLFWKRGNIFFWKIILETFGWKEFSPYLCTRFSRRAVRRIFGSDERKEFFERIYIDRESSTGSVRRASVPSGRVEETNRSVFASLRSGGAVVLWTRNS